MATTIRLKPKTHEALKQIAQVTGETLQQALENSVEERRRRVYLEGLHEDYAALRSDRKTSAALEKEMALWEQTSADGLEDL